MKMFDNRQQHYEHYIFGLKYSLASDCWIDNLISA